MASQPHSAAPPAAQTATDDFALMAGIRSRDPSALSAFYERYGGVVYGVCLRALRDPGEAEDLLIEIFWELWERGERFDASRGSPVGHVLGLARSRVVDRLRSRKSRDRAATDGSHALQAVFAARMRSEGPLVSAILAEQRVRVTGALKALPPDQRQALEMAFFDAMSHSEVAEKLQQPVGTVKSRIRQALIHLRGTLASDNQT
jgi:RNA polymerase sigma-70 factor (ECF subfamily)